MREYLLHPLQGYTLQKGEYRLMEGRPLVSKVLGLEVREEGKDWLCLYDPQTGKKPLTPLEAQAARRQEAFARHREAFARRQAEDRATQAEDRATQEAAARRQAEADLDRLRAELAHLRGA